MVELAEDVQPQTIDEIFSTFVPVREREWYPWVTPSKDWFRKASPVQIEEFERKLRKYARQDFFFFAEHVMRNPTDINLHIGLHDQLCHLFQYATTAGILVPRNHLKSTIGSQQYSLWRMGLNPNIRIIIATATLDLAQDIISYIKNSITENRRLNVVFPELQPSQSNLNSRYEKWNSAAFTIKHTLFTKEATVQAMGMDKQTKTGKHCDLFIYDDIITEDNASSSNKLKTVKKRYESSRSLTDDLRTITQSLMIGTRYRIDDIYGDLIGKGDMPFYIRKAIEDGKYCWDHPRSIRRVKIKKSEISAGEFARQYQNEAIADEDKEFQEGWIRRWDYALIKAQLQPMFEDDLPKRHDVLLKMWYRSLDIYMGVDPARKVGKRNNKTAIVVTGVDTEGHEYDLYVFKKQIQPELIHEKVVEVYLMFLEYGLKKCGIETYGGDYHVYRAVRNKLKEDKQPYTKVIEFDKIRGMDGTERIQSLTVPMRDGMLFIGTGPEWSEYETEIINFTEEEVSRVDDLLTAKAYIHLQFVKPKLKEIDKLDYGHVRNRLRRYNPQRTSQGSWLTA